MRCIAPCRHRAATPSPHPPSRPAPRQALSNAQPPTISVRQLDFTCTHQSLTYTLPSAFTLPLPPDTLRPARARFAPRLNLRQRSTCANFILVAPINPVTYTLPSLPTPVALPVRDPEMPRRPIPLRLEALEDRNL